MSSYDPQLARAYYLPRAIEAAEHKLAALYAEYHGLTDYQIARPDRVFHPTWQAKAESDGIDFDRIEQAQGELGDAA